MSPVKNVLLVGANGTLGPAVLKQLLATGFKVTILSREGSMATFPAEIPLLKTDYSPQSLATAVKDQNAIISTVGVLGKMEQIKLIDAAVASPGTKRFIPSDFSYRSFDMSEIERRIPSVGKRLAANKVILDYLTEKAAKNPCFTWTAIGGASLFDWTLTSLILDSGNEPYLATTILQLARAVVSTLQHLDTTANKYLTVHSVFTTQNRILAAAEKATGDKFVVTHASADDTLKEGLQLTEKEQFLPGLGKMWAAYFWKDGEGGAKDVGDNNDILGLEEEDLVEIISGIVSG